ncbi:DMT family transporter [Caldimonas tepidiphila]|uniref:DMT family transporter n=1 Tax=Caldimonas tepidiphila TaxID=2315841 RepID=UPI000E5BC37F|nr:DMT family transporter [Caldimonas tepidiphila]
MNTASTLRLLALAALWGASFLFMRIGAPAFGPAWLMEARVGLAALFLAGIALALRRPLRLRERRAHYLVLGFFNSALPFLLYGFAARTLPASLLSVLNATAPIWGAVIGALWTRTALSPRTLVGLALGISGVALLVGLDTAVLHPGAALSVLACLGATCCYGIASVYARTAPRAQGVDPFSNTHGSMWAATLLLVPALPFFPAPAPAAPGALAAVLALGVLCTAVAYLLYFRLIADIGATRSLTVTFLIPVFGMLFGHLFLGEPLGWHTAAGAALVLAGTALVTGFSPAGLLARKETAHG